MSQYFKIPKANSIRFSKVRLLNELKNDDNTLSSESLNEFLYREVEKFLTTDTIPTQFKSAYTTNVAIITDENGTDTTLSVTKKTLNLGREYSLDGRYYNYKSEGVYTGVYFTTGNEYNYNTVTISGTHTLNGLLPEFAIIGEDIEIVGVGTYPVARLVYDSDVDANVILLLNTYSGADTAKQIESQYDIEEYEVYEYDIDFSTYLNTVTTTITVSETLKRTLVAKSENINIQEEHSGTLEIIYYNEDNDDILYSTGIKHKMRLEYFNIIAISENENEINLTDETSVLISSDIYGKNKFLFQDLSNEEMRKLKIALSSDILIINDEGYTVSGAINEEYIENTNLYVVEATLNKTGVNYYVDARLALAAAHRTRVLALSGGVIDAYQCILTEYDDNY